MLLLELHLVVKNLAARLKAEAIPHVLSGTAQHER